MSHAIFVEQVVIDRINSYRLEYRQKASRGDIYAVGEYRDFLIGLLGESNGCLIFNHRAHLRPILKKEMMIATDFALKVCDVD